MFYRSSYPAKAIMLLCIVVLASALSIGFGITQPNEYENSRKEIMMRKIGHEVLLQAGDSSSRVLPVQRISNNEYVIRFENEFTFDPDSFVKLVTESMAAMNREQNYIVSVIDCTQQAVIFGFSISGLQKDDIIACSGREQPRSCYSINIKFREESMLTASQKNYLIGGIPLLAFIGLILSGSAIRGNRRKANFDANAAASHMLIGKSVFVPSARQIINGSHTISLTSKETKLLLIFASNPNVLIERSRLQKEIWEDEGVIVGRSLDMFISKLRKKLESDPEIRLTNIHGKGYKLEIDN